MEHEDGKESSKLLKLFLMPSVTQADMQPKTQLKLKSLFKPEKKFFLMFQFYFISELFLFQDIMTEPKRSRYKLYCNRV